MYSLVHAHVVQTSAKAQWLKQALGLLLWTLCVVVWSCPVKSHAAVMRVGLLGVDGSSVEPAVGQALTQALRTHLPKLRTMQVEMKQQDLSEVKLVYGCTDERPACMTSVGQNLGVDRLIFGSVTRQGSAGLYLVSLKQLNVTDGTIEKYLTETVSAQVLLPENPQLNQLAQRWLESLLSDRNRGSLRVLTKQPGVQVLLDGVTLGEAPLLFPDVEAGDHLLGLAQAGGGTTQKRLRVRAGELTSVSFDPLHTEPLVIQTEALSSQTSPALAGLGTTEPDRTAFGQKTSRVLRITAFVAAGLAVVTAAAAIGTASEASRAKTVSRAQLDAIVAGIPASDSMNPQLLFAQDALTASDCPTSAAFGSMMAFETNYALYQSNCQRQQRLSPIAVGLGITAGTLGVVALTTGILSALRKSDLSDSHAAPAKTAALRPRLLFIAPSITPTSVVTTAAFAF